MANILVLSASWPFPVQKGNQKYLVTILEMLKRHGHRVSYCAIQDNRLSQTNVDQITDYVDELFYIPAVVNPKISRDFYRSLKSFIRASNYRKTLFITILSSTVSVLSGTNQAISGSYVSRTYIGRFMVSLLSKKLSSISQALRSYGLQCQKITNLTATCSSKKISHVILNYAHHADLLKIVGKTKKMILTIDALSLIESKIKEHGGNTSGRELSVEYESYLLNQADVCIAIEESEQAYFQKILSSNTKVIVVKHKPSFTFYPPPRKNGRYRLRIGFIGANNPLNIQGIKDFLEYSWPLIIEKCPEAELIIAGPISKVIEHSGKSYVNTKFMGFLDSVGTFYECVSICINPVSLGTGMKIKSIEAICNGRPLVSFPEGLAGFDISRYAYFSQDSSVKYPYFRCSNYIHFAKAVIDLLLNDDLYYKAASLCADYVNTNMNDRVVYGDFLRELD
jgi:hypothetical protein